MLRPSRPMMRPFISSLGRSTTETVLSTTWSAATRWMASEMMRLARLLASWLASSSIRRIDLGGVHARLVLHGAHQLRLGLLGGQAGDPLQHGALLGDPRRDGVLLEGNCRLALVEVAAALDPPGASARPPGRARSLHRRARAARACCSMSQQLLPVLPCLPLELGARLRAASPAPAIAASLTSCSASCCGHGQQPAALPLGAGAADSAPPPGRAARPARQAARHSPRHSERPPCAAASDEYHQCRSFTSPFQGTRGTARE